MWTTSLVSFDIAVIFFTKELIPKIIKDILLGALVSQ